MNVNSHPDTPVNRKYNRYKVYLVLCFAALMFALDSQAAECIKFKNEKVLNSGAVQRTYIVSGMPSAELCTESVVQTGLEYTAMKTQADSSVDMTSIINTLVSLFEFDAQTMVAFHAACLVAFLTGHGTGRVAREMGRV